MIFLILFSFVAGKLCSNTENLKNSDQFLKCVNSLDIEACEIARIEFEKNSHLCLETAEALTITQRIYDFTAGFYNGLQKNATAPSNCVKSLINLRLSWERLFNGLTFINFEAPVNLIFNFNELVQKLYSTYGLCQFSTVYNIFHPSTIPLGLNTILTHWLVKKDDIHKQFDYISNNITLNDYASTGISFGIIFTYLTGYQIN